MYVCMLACFFVRNKKNRIQPCIGKTRRLHPLPAAWSTAPDRGNGAFVFPICLDFFGPKNPSLSASKLLGMVQNEGSSDQAPSFGDLKSCLIDNMIMSFLVLRCSISKQSPGLGSKDLSQFPRQFTHEQQ